MHHHHVTLTGPISPASKRPLHSCGEPRGPQIGTPPPMWPSKALYVSPPGCRRRTGPGRTTHCPPGLSPCYSHLRIFLELYRGSLRALWKPVLLEGGTQLSPLSIKSQHAAKRACLAETRLRSISMRSCFTCTCRTRTHVPLAPFYKTVIRRCVQLMVIDGYDGHYGYIGYTPIRY